MLRAPPGVCKRGPALASSSARPYNAGSATETSMAEYADDEGDLDFSEEDEGDDTVPCPYCGAAAYEGAERCPRCENYISREDAPSQIPLWIKATAVVCLVAAVAWIIHGC
jgi:hypothetical protein